MTRAQLEHLIRAATQIVDDKDLIVIGSQAVLGQFPDAPEALLRSEEADVFPKNKPELSDLIDGTIGELSPFHEVFGYYAHGVSEDTAVLPSGWRERLVPLYNDNTRGATGWCLEIHDIVLSKLVAGREKDLDYAQEAARHRLLDKKTLNDRLATTELIPERRQLVASRITGLFNG